MVSKVFLSYRRSDSPHASGRLRDRLTMAFGEENVFFDVDSIPTGRDFREVIRTAIRAADAVVVMMGPGFDVARLSDQRDYVRMELLEAFSQKKVIVPVLIDTTSMPPAAALPPSLRKLAYINASPIRHDPDFHRDAERLIATLRRISDAGGQNSSLAPRSRPAPDRIELSRSVHEVLSSAVGLAGERPVDASVVLLAALLYAHKTRLPGMTGALLLSLSELQSDSHDPEDLLERLGRAIGVAVTDEQASTRVVDSHMAVAPLAVLLTSAAQVAKRVSDHSKVHLRHLMAAAILATEPPLRPQVLRELGISAGKIRELLREAALAETSGEPVGAWRELISRPQSHRRGR